MITFRVIQDNDTEDAYPQKTRCGMCPQCRIDAVHSEFFREKSLPGYKFRLCMCPQCNDKWTEVRKLSPSELKELKKERRP